MYLVTQLNQKELTVGVNFLSNKRDEKAAGVNVLYISKLRRNIECPTKASVF